MFILKASAVNSCLFSEAQVCLIFKQTVHQRLGRRCFDGMLQDFNFGDFKTIKNSFQIFSFFLTFRFNTTSVIFFLLINIYVSYF